MQRRGQFFSVFFLFFVFTLIVFFFAQTDFGRGVTGLTEQVMVPFQRVIFPLLSHGTSDSQELSSLKEENSKLLLQVAKQKSLEKENQALRDQFETTSPSPRKLLPAQVIGMHDEELILDKGTRDKIKVGNSVVVKESIIGKVVRVSDHLSVVELLMHPHTSFTAETVKTSALGVIKGRDGEILLDNVVLSDKLEKNDLVKTKGDSDKEGNGSPPGLVVGKVISVNKKASALFQQAEIESLVNIAKLKLVFVLLENK